MNVVIVTGPRDWSCPTLAHRVVSRLKVAFGDTLVIRHGAANGVDASFEESARSHSVRTDPRPADWKAFGKGAGPRRNLEMIADGAAFVIACRRDPEWTRGTLDCVTQAMAAGLAVYVIESEYGEPRRLRELPAQA